MGESLLILVNQSPLLISLSLLGCVINHTSLSSKPRSIIYKWEDPGEGLKAFAEIDMGRGPWKQKRGCRLGRQTHPDEIRAENGKERGEHSSWVVWKHLGDFGEEARGMIILFLTPLQVLLRLVSIEGRALTPEHQTPYIVYPVFILYWSIAD